MKTLVALVLLLACGQAVAKDGFANVRCTADITEALIGQHDLNEPVSVTEARHKDLGLKDLGADEISDTLSLIFWRICGKKFAVLEDNHTSLIHDALELPQESKSNPAFDGICKLDGKDMAESSVAILRDSPGQAMLPADVAWKIDAKAKKLVKIPTDKLLCPRDGIMSLNGGN